MNSSHTTNLLIVAKIYENPEYFMQVLDCDLTYEVCVIAIQLRPENINRILAIGSVSNDNSLSIDHITNKALKKIIHLLSSMIDKFGIQILNYIDSDEFKLLSIVLSNIKHDRVSEIKACGLLDNVRHIDIVSTILKYQTSTVLLCHFITQNMLEYVVKHAINNDSIIDFFNINPDMLSEQSLLTMMEKSARLVVSNLSSQIYPNISNECIEDIIRNNINIIITKNNFVFYNLNDKSAITILANGLTNEYRGKMLDVMKYYTPNYNEFSKTPYFKKEFSKLYLLHGPF